MRVVQEYLKNKQEFLRYHPFFKELSVQKDFSEGMVFVPRLLFWALIFQDILKMIPLQMQTPKLRSIALQHRVEDSGHDKWLLQDLQFLGNKDLLTIEWLFSSEHWVTRKLSYFIMHEAFHGNDYQKIVLLLALESTGHVFFENLGDFVKNHGQDANLKYLSNFHLTVERNHAVFEEEPLEELQSIILSEGERTEAKLMIDRIYEAFDMLFNYLLEAFSSESTHEELDELQPLVA